MHVVQMLEASAVHPEYGRYQAVRRRKFRFWQRVKIHTMAINAAIRECVNY